MMALLWGQEPLHGHFTVTPCLASSILVCIWISMESQSSYDVWLCSCFSLIRTGSSLHVEYVDMERDKGDTYQDRLLFLGLENILLVCWQGVISFWHVKTCLLSPYGAEGCVTHSHLCCDSMDFIGVVIFWVRIEMVIFTLLMLVPVLQMLNGRLLEAKAIDNIITNDPEIFLVWLGTAFFTKYICYKFKDTVEVFLL